MHPPHSARAYDSDLASVGARIASMGGHAERMVEQAVAALVSGDTELARQVVADDAQLDEAQRWIDERTIVLIARMHPPHSARAYDSDLASVGARIASMGGHAERMVEQAVAALISADTELARQVVADDAQLDEAQRWIDERTIVLIARRQPVAGDLREIIGAIRISGELERVGDLGKNIAKRVVAVSEISQPVRLFRGLEALAGLALAQLKQVLDIYASRSITGIAYVRGRDEEIDAHYTSLFRELLTYMMEDPRNISSCTHLLFCAKNIERIGDHATNIAETVHYVVTGTQMPSERPKFDASHEVVVAGEEPVADDGEG